MTEPADSLDTTPAVAAQQPEFRLLTLPVRLLAATVRAAVIIALAVVLVFTVGQVADRYFLKSQFDAHDQIARIGMVWLVFLGFAIGVRERANIRIEVVQHFLPAGARQIAAFLLDILMLAVTVLIITVGWQLLEIGSFQAIMGTSLYYDVMYGALLTGMILLAVFLILRIANTLSGGRLGVDAPVSEHDDHH